MKLSDTVPYQNILSDLSWLDSNVQLDPPTFAEEFLRDIADKLSSLVFGIEDGDEV